MPHLSSCASPEHFARPFAPSTRYNPIMIKGLDSALGGIASRLDSFQRTAARIAQPADPTLERDLVQTMADSSGVAANAKVARTADEMVGKLIDIFA
jgi:hypothetical protein